MPALIRAYDPENCIVTWGKHLTGFAEGEMIKVSRKESSSEVVVGTQGEQAKVIKRNRSGEIVIRTMGTADINDFLQAQLDLDEASGSGTLPFNVRDGKSQCSAAAAWIEKQPDWVRSNGIYVNEWTLITGYIYIHHAGTSLL